MPVHVFGKTIGTGEATVIAGGSALAIWFAWKQHKASSTSGGIDPVTGLPASQDTATDPLTGQEYLSEAQEYGSVAAAEQATAGESAVDYGTGGTSSGSSGTGTDANLVPASTVQGTTYGSNAAWAQAAEAGLTDIGYTSTDVAAALGRYLAGLSETAAQATITQAAIAEYGPPPVGSFQVIQAPPAGPVTTGGGTGKPVSVAPSGFKVTSVSGANVSLAWNKLTPPAGEGPVTGYVIAYGPVSGSQAYSYTVGPGETSATISGVGAGAAGKHYFELWADPAAKGGPHAGPVEATTKKS